MSAFLWWRSWHGAPMDNKWPVIAARAGVKVGVVSAVAWALFDYASQHDDRGTVDGFDTEVYSVYSGFAEVEIVAVIQAMTDKKIIVDGKLFNWAKRQPKREDDSYNRVTKHREMKRNVTQCNADESIETIREESDKDTDEDKDTETEQSAPDPFSLMQRSVETLTGFISTPKDISAIDEYVKTGVIEDDVKAAIAFFASIGKTARGAADLRNSVMTSKGKRIQGANGHKQDQTIVYDADGNSWRL